MMVGVCCSTQYLALRDCTHPLDFCVQEGLCHSVGAGHQLCPLVCCWVVVELQLLSLATGWNHCCAAYWGDFVSLAVWSDSRFTSVLATLVGKSSAKTVLPSISRHQLGSQKWDEKVVGVMMMMVEPMMDGWLCGWGTQLTTFVPLPGSGALFWLPSDPRDDSKLLCTARMTTALLKVTSLGFEKCGSVAVNTPLFHTSWPVQEPQKVTSSTFKTHGCVMINALPHFLACGALSGEPPSSKHTTTPTTVQTHHRA